MILILFFSPPATASLQASVFFSFYHFVVARYRHVPTEQTLKREMRSMIDSVPVTVVQFNSKPDNKKKNKKRNTISFPFQSGPEEIRGAEEADKQINISAHERDFAG